MLTTLGERVMYPWLFKLSYLNEFIKGITFSIFFRWFISRICFSPEVPSFQTKASREVRLYRSKLVTIHGFLPTYPLEGITLCKQVSCTCQLLAVVFCQLGHAMHASCSFLLILFMLRYVHRIIDHGCIFPRVRMKRLKVR